MKPHIPKFLLTALLALTCHSTFAQAPNGASADEVAAELPQVQFRTLALQRLDDDETFYKTRSGFEKLPLDYFRPSKKQAAVLLPDGSLPLFEKTEDPELGVQYVMKDRVALPSGSRRVLLLAAQGNDKVAMKAVKDNLSANNTDWLYINVSRSPIAVQLGDKGKPFAIPPGQSVFSKADVTVGEGTAIRVVANKGEGEGWEKIYSRFWPVYEGQRCMVIFMENEGEIDVFNFFEAVDLTSG